MIAWMQQIKKAAPAVRFGYFNPPKEFMMQKRSGFQQKAEKKSSHLSAGMTH
jgi:hypothetical protein